MEVSGATSILQSSLQTSPQQVQGQTQSQSTDTRTSSPSAVVPQQAAGSVDFLAEDVEPVAAAEESVATDETLGSTVDVFA